MVRYAASDVLDDAAIARGCRRPTPAVLERERLAQRMTARVATTACARRRARRASCSPSTPPPRLADAGRRLRAFGDREPRQRPAGRRGAARARRPAAAHRPAGPAWPQGRARAVRRARGPARRARPRRAGLPAGTNRARAVPRALPRAGPRGDGRARPTVYTLGADTGRMSCVRPNLQQVPREGGFRACITADPGTC
jgi:hypothetical protein